jgi:hypothetical protein
MIWNPRSRRLCIYDIYIFNTIHVLQGDARVKQRALQLIDAICHRVVMEHASAQQPVHAPIRGSGGEMRFLPSGRVHFVGVDAFTGACHRRWALLQARPIAPGVPPLSSELKGGAPLLRDLVLFCVKVVGGRSFANIEMIGRTPTHFDVNVVVNTLRCECCCAWVSIGLKLYDGVRAEGRHRCP